jgi:protein-S-isoprenylcysteine O-methyltransferase Ste14
VKWFKQRLEDPNGGQVLSACIALSLLVLVQVLVVVSIWHDFEHGRWIENSGVVFVGASLILSSRLIKFLRDSYAR